MSWRPSSDAETASRRAALLERARGFFSARGVLAVDTPALSRAAASDPNVDSLSVRSSLSDQPLYLVTSPESAMKRLLAAGYPDHPALSRGTATIRAAQDLTGAAPNLDLALALLGRVVGLPTDAGIAIFAAGRSVGWIGHALEQYSTRRLIRPRARYVGLPPGTAPSDGI